MIDDSFDIEPFDLSPSQLPVPRAAYSDRAAALMARLSELAYDPRFDAPVSNPPPELTKLGFHAVEIFADDQTEGLAILARSTEMIVLCFRGTKYPENLATGAAMDLVDPCGLKGADKKLRLHRGFFEAFDRLALARLEDAVQTAK